MMTTEEITWLRLWAEDVIRSGGVPSDWYCYRPRQLLLAAERVRVIVAAAEHFGRIAFPEERSK